MAVGSGVSGHKIAWVPGGLYEFLGLLPFERGVRVSPLTVQRVGQRGMRLSVIWICVDCRLKLGDGVRDLTSFKEHPAGVEGEVRALAADGDAAEIGRSFAFGGRSCSDLPAG